MRKYKARIADKILEKRLLGKGAVLIEGAKWCGKTTTAEQIAGSILYMADPEKEKQNLTIEEMEAWNPNLRAKTAIRTSNTRYFVDPSIAVAAPGFDRRSEYVWSVF